MRRTVWAMVLPSAPSVMFRLGDRNDIARHAREISVLSGRRQPHAHAAGSTLTLMWSPEERALFVACSMNPQLPERPGQ